MGALIQEHTSLLLPGDKLIKSASEEFVRKDPSDSSRPSLVGVQKNTGYGNVHTLQY